MAGHELLREIFTTSSMHYYWKMVFLFALCCVGHLNGNALDFIHSLALLTNVHGLQLSVGNVEMTSSKTDRLSVIQTSPIFG